MTPKEIWNEKISKQIIKSLEFHHFEAYFCKTKEEAKQKILTLIEKNDLIGWGGSTTMAEIGILEEIKNGKYRIIDRDNSKNPQEKLELTRKTLLADTFLSGTNAITEDGELFNIDGNGNRVAAITFGPKKVIIACGVNKIVKNYEEAVARVRNYAAPINAQRFEPETPCKATGKCANCNSINSICNSFVLTRQSKPAGRIKVIIIGETLGF